MIHTSTREVVIATLATAFREGDPSESIYGGTPDDLLAMVLRRGHSEWPDYIADLVPLYVEHDQAANLGQGLIKTIAVLDAGEYSPAQLDRWNQAWQEVGKGHEDLEIALSSLDAATEAIKTRSERPLFQLPPEIRTLVRPLLNHTLGEEGS